MLASGSNPFGNVASAIRPAPSAERAANVAAATNSVTKITTPNDAIPDPTAIRHRRNVPKPLQAVSAIDPKFTPSPAKVFGLPQWRPNGRDFLPGVSVEEAEKRAPLGVATQYIAGEEGERAGALQERVENLTSKLSTLWWILIGLGIGVGLLVFIDLISKFR